MTNQDTAETNQDTADRLITELRGRARRLRAYAISILCIIVTVLGVGSWVFINADSRALNDTLRLAPPDVVKLNKQIDDLDAQRTNLAEQRAQAHERYDTALNSSDDTNVRNTWTDKYLREISTIDKQIDQLDEKSTKLSQERRKLVDAIPTNEAHLASTISALTTRIGAVILLLFLVQILTPLFRYNMMLAAHYDARADGLVLLPWASTSTEAQVLEQVVHTMSPHTVSFGPAPQSPIERTIDLAAQVLTKK